MNLGAAPRRSSKPNILIVMADQHRAGLTRRCGYPIDTMPALDRLAEGGVAFDRAYTTAPLCVPARISMLTGRWPHAHRVRENGGTKQIVYEADIFDIARKQGYKVGLAGKNHSHLTPEKMDYFRPYMHDGALRPIEPVGDNAAYDAWLHKLNHGISPVPTPFPVETQLPYRIVSDSIEFMEKAGDSPFLLWTSFPEPHNPYQVPKPYFDMYPPESVPQRACGPEVLKSKGFKWEWLHGLENATYPGVDTRWRRTRSNYLGMLRLIDDQLARLLQRVDLENTIVVYLADHGDYFCDYGLIRKGVELPEVLTRIPMVWSGWGIGKRSADPAFVSIADVMPTLCEALGADIPHGAQGRSLWPLLTGRDYPREEFRSIYSEVGFGGLHYSAADKPDFAIGQKGSTFDELNPITQSGYMKMVRMDDWKLTLDMMGAGQLYNLATDPYELKNLYGDPSSAAAQMRMSAELLAWTIRTQDNLPTAHYQAKWPQRNWYAPYRGPKS